MDYLSLFFTRNASSTSSILIFINLVFRHVFYISPDALFACSILECAAELLQLPHVEVNVQNKLGDTALHNASWKGHADIVELLLQRGANKNIRNNEKKLPYDLARNPEAAAFLKDRADVPTNDYGVDEDSD